MGRGIPVTDGRGTARRALRLVARPSYFLDRACRAAIRGLSRVVPLPLDLRVELDATERPAYAYCAYHAAALAKRLGYRAVSALEFVVAGGNGLVFLDSFAGEVERGLGVRVELYGFDTGRGLPAPGSSRDLMS